MYIFFMTCSWFREVYYYYLIFYYYLKGVRTALPAPPPPSSQARPPSYAAGSLTTLASRVSTIKYAECMSLKATAMAIM